ncbi:MAG: hypothetical protein H6712_15055 [Myxococcales bacterium]|nr:hypothetical protein [Myxococcales bacterium]MCB9715184.1 hypothetical protein [Myxococcales bacterium]
MTTINITTTAPDQVKEVTVTLDEEAVYSVPEDGVYEPEASVMATIEVLLAPECPASAITFGETSEGIEIRIEGTSSAPVSVPLRLTFEAEVSAVHWHKGYTTKVSKAG